MYIVWQTRICYCFSFIKSGKKPAREVSASKMQRKSICFDERQSVKAAGSWQRQVDVGASGNVHNKNNY
jgi:hypothetical protein